ncbi:MAG TPA: tRNA pseudouridine(55) synthase TruB [Firmicutes bacterium]|jgi:tRNA pseudouridine55 synthase|nr:tRNA pseudouridine(55) synthase TruB [Bacillota bacterium]
MRHGILIINKERGMTSHQVVAILRRILKQSEVGHTGTLDPEATGVLVVGLGQATRSFSFLNEKSKVYRGEIILGQSTDTQDATGQILQEQPKTILSLEDLQKGMMGLTGKLNQIPPMYSAVKVHGQKLYDLARKGLTIDRQPRGIEVQKWEILNSKETYGFKESVFVEITCSKGTYIRTLIHDLGTGLGTGAHMGSLKRLRSGKFSLDHSLKIAEVEEHLAAGTLESHLISVRGALDHLFTLQPSMDDVSKVLHGGKLSFQKYPSESTIDSLAKVLDQSLEVIAVVQLKQDNTGSYLYWQPVKVFHYLF